MAARFARARATYVGLSVTTFTALVLFGLLNGGVFVWRLVRSSEPPLLQEFPLDLVVKAHRGLDAGQVRALLVEQQAIEVLRYEPFTEFRPGASSGRYFNVSDVGARHVRDQAPWPPDPGDRTVFLFGGSTAFGSGLPDGETVASHLQDVLRAGGGAGPRISVYNFGRPRYYSSQERVLFEQLATAGYRPSIAVFLDGLNDFVTREDPRTGFLWMTDQSRTLRELFRERQEHHTAHLLLALLRRLPLTRWFSDRLHERRPREADWGTPGAMSPDAVVRRYLTNRTLLEGAAKALGVETLFVWQPVPTYRYDKRRHLFWDAQTEALAAWTEGYDARKDEQLADAACLWLADMQEGLSENLYVDRVHYSASFSRRIAEKIAERLQPLLAAGR